LHWFKFSGFFQKAETISRKKLEQESWKKSPEFLCQTLAMIGAICWKIAANKPAAMISGKKLETHKITAKAKTRGIGAKPPLHPGR